MPPAVYKSVDGVRSLIHKTVECKDWGNFKPLYPSDSYKGFVAHQKLKGLSRKNWKNLPKMWKKELGFRKELEKCLLS